MKLQTTVEVQTPQRQIDFQSQLLLVGSCFTENIGARLRAYKLSTFLNPCGIAYNPVSVLNSIQFLTGSKKMRSSDCILHNELWHSLHHHGSFSREKKDDLLTAAQLKMAQGKEAINNATHIFLTLGTAWVFRHIATNQLINNCHKLPTKEFQRQKLTLQEATALLHEMVAEIRKKNATAEVIFTVSPVRHSKDGLHENQLSKATLLLAIETVQQQYPNILYFPAYELALDELRDYRFFAEDFCHLNALGTSYIWEKFVACYITKAAQQHFPAIEKLQKSVQHKVQKPKSTQYQDFLKKVRMQIKELEEKLPFADFSEEKKKLQESVRNSK